MQNSVNDTNKTFTRKRDAYGGSATVGAGVKESNNGVKQCETRRKYEVGKCKNAREDKERECFRCDKKIQSRSYMQNQAA